MPRIATARRFGRALALCQSLALAAVAAFGLSSPASAQIADQIDGARLEQWRARTGNVLRFCTYPSSTTAAFDLRVAEEIAARLLLTPRFHNMPEGYSIASEFAGEDFYIALVNDCDVALTLAIVPGAFPPEFTVSRPMVAFSYILVTDDPAISGLSDIPASETIGGSLMSYGDYILGAYIRGLPEDRRWRRLPFGTTTQMLDRLLDDSIAAMVIYAPSYARLLEDRPEVAEALHVLPLEVGLTPFMNRGAVLLAQNAFLRIEIDNAIEDMISDGTFAAILSETGMDAYPVRIGGI